MLPKSSLSKSLATALILFCATGMVLAKDKDGGTGAPVYTVVDSNMKPVGTTISTDGYSANVILEVVDSSGLTKHVLVNATKDGFTVLTSESPGEIGPIYFEQRDCLGSPIFASPTTTKTFASVSDFRAIITDNGSGIIDLYIPSGVEEQFDTRSVSSRGQYCMNYPGLPATFPTVGYKGELVLQNLHNTYVPPFDVIAN